MKKRLPEILCMAAVLVGLLALAAQARAEQTHRAYLYGYPDGTIRPEAEVSRAAFACILLRLAENELPEGARVRFWDVPGTSWAYAAVTRLAGLGLLPFGSDGWFRPDAGLTWRDFSGVLDKLAQTEAGRAAFPVLAAAWSEKTLAAAEADEAAAEAVLTRAELARALNSLLGRCPDGQDAQLQAAAWYRDNQDQTAWYYADLIEAGFCRRASSGQPSGKAAPHNCVCALRRIFSADPAALPQKVCPSGQAFSLRVHDLFKQNVCRYGIIYYSESKKK